MRSVLGRAAALLCGAMAATGCGSASTSSIGGPSAVKCQVSVSGGNTSFPAQGGSGGFTVSTTRDCSWSADPTVPWIHLGSNASGQGAADVPYSVDPNSAQSGRSGQIVVSAQSLSVTQAAAPPPPPPPTPAPAPAPPPGTGVKVNIDGKVANLLGSCPSLRFSLDGRIVTTTGATAFKDIACGEIVNGSRVKVTGEVLSDGTVLASKVEED